MSVNISVYILAGIVMLSLMTGIWIGRSIRWMMADTERRVEETEEIIPVNAECFPVGRALCSPVNGCVREFGERGNKGVILQPEQGILHAPVSGKIVRLFPLGNKMLIRSDAGVEFVLSVGESGDEMHSEYYRAHIMQNEIVTKGKVLLEFDLERMNRDGVDTEVSLLVESSDCYKAIVPTRKTYVKNGEEILWISGQVGLV